MKVMIAGGTGTLGRRIATALSREGREIAVLTRSPRKAFPFRQVQWDGRSVGGWATELEGAVVINLAGELVDKRPTASNVELLRRSRTEPTRALVEATRACTRPPVLWLQASTTAIYADAGEDVITEKSPVPKGLPQMTGVAVPWEEASRDANCERRITILRMSLAFDTDTPVFDRLSRIVKLGLGGRISSGRQWVSWIHIHDLLAALRFLIESDLEGTFLVTSPEPVQNETLMRELRKHLRRPWSPPVPAPLVRMGAFLMRSDPALALTGRRCIPERLVEAGFRFSFPDLSTALDDLLGPRPG